METTITRTSKTEFSTHVEASCGKVTAYVGIGKNGVSVCAYNAAHKTWRGMGRTFRTVAEAIDGYKSAEMKAIIRAAEAVVA